MTRQSIHVAVLDDYQHAARQSADWTALPEHVRVTFHSDHIENPSALEDRLHPYDVICLMRERTKLDAEMLRNLPNLKLIVTTAMRNAALDIAAAQQLGIVVCGTQAPQNGTPELIWLHILAHARHLEQERSALERGQWQVTVGQDLHGAVLGLVGLGRIGQRVAQVANAFGMQVLAWSPNLTAERAHAAGARFVSKADLFSQADYIVIAMQLRNSTRHLVSEAELSRMKPNAYFINTSRAGLVDESALIQALRESRIAGAGLDVFHTEPLPREHPFRTLPNVLITPHLGYVTRAAYEQFYRETVEDIQAWMAGEPIRELDLAHQ
ncbi:Hydroxypyruvate reductase [Achromobacter veterisilvae]|uniref:Hydroxypyruvate reductase n=1 Tax=Achromobacter veterisilvae TaxID=2069367 RepID=A0A446CI61_9BURK|nr:D-2-hydroxyacid dehydrogenase family protein [Achromobacter veterisilvae]SSW67570.1 Hydroxypyruvate reductase [Achromobacter veterisilvae]